MPASEAESQARSALALQLAHWNLDTLAHTLAGAYPVAIYAEPAAPLLLRAPRFIVSVDRRPSKGIQHGLALRQLSRSELNSPLQDNGRNRAKYVQH